MNRKQRSKHIRSTYSQRGNSRIVCTMNMYKTDMYNGPYYDVFIAYINYNYKWFFMILQYTEVYESEGERSHVSAYPTHGTGKRIQQRSFRSPQPLHQRLVILLQIFIVHVQSLHTWNLCHPLSNLITGP